MTTFLQGGRVALSALSTFTNAASHAVAEGDAGKLRDLAEQCRSWLRQYPNEPFFTTFESLFAKAASLIEIEGPKRILEKDPSSLRIMRTLSGRGPCRITELVKFSKISRKTFFNRGPELHKMGLLHYASPGYPYYKATRLGRDVVALIL